MIADVHSFFVQIFIAGAARGPGIKECILRDGNNHSFESRGTEVRLIHCAELIVSSYQGRFSSALL